MSTSNPANLPTSLLLVESDRLLRDRLAAAIRTTGVDVLLACDASRAVVIAQAGRPEIVLSSSSLADASGWLLTAKLRFAGYWSRTWLYAPRSTTYDRQWAAYLGIDCLFYFGSSEHAFAAEIADRLLRDGRERPSISREDLETYSFPTIRSVTTYSGK